MYEASACVLQIRHIHSRIYYTFDAFQLAKDPKAFAEKMKAIWAHLSEDEPENQKPPENIEQLIEMLTRESARRFVHVTNFVAKNVYLAPAHAGHAFTYTAQEVSVMVDKFIKVSYNNTRFQKYYYPRPNTIALFIENRFEIHKYLYCNVSLLFLRLYLYKNFSRQPDFASSCDSR